MMLNATKRVHALILSALACSLSIVSFAEVPPVGIKRPVITNPQPNPNLAFGKPVTGSNYWRAGSEPSRIVDGIIGINLFGAWQSNAQAEKPDWLLIDLEEPQTFDTLRLYVAGQYGVAKKSFPGFRISAGLTPEALETVFEAGPEEADQYINRSIGAESAYIQLGTQHARYLKLTLASSGKATLGEFEVYLGEPPLRTRTVEPGDTRIRVRPEIKPQVLFAKNELILWHETAAEKVFRDDKIMTSAQSDPRIKVDAARGEFESFQVVVHSEQGIDGLRWSFSDLKGPDGAMITAQRIKANPVGYYYIRRPEGTETHRLTVNGWGPEYTAIGEGFFPDILLDQEWMNVPPGKHQPLWVTISMPRSATPGTYVGIMTLTLPDEEPIELTIELLARDFELPSPRTLRTYANLIREDRSWVYDHLDSIQLDNTTMKNMYRLMAEHGFGVALLWPGPSIEWVQGEPVIDWTKFDEMATYCIEELKLPYMTIPGTLFAYHEAIYPNTSFLGKQLEPMSPQWLEAYDKVTAAWGRHLAEKGWEEHFGFYIGNEVQSLRDPSVVDRAVELLRRAKVAAPNLTYIWHSGPLDPVGLEEADIFVFNPRRTPMQLLQQRHIEGKPSFSYANYTKCINSPTMACRGTGWILFKHRISGYTLHSTTEDWAGTNPHVHMSEANGTFFYPPWEHGGEFMGSIRLAMFRDGFDDYEYLVLLEQLAEAGRNDPAKAAAVKRADELLARARDFAGDHGFEQTMPPGMGHIERMQWGNALVEAGEPEFSHLEDPDLLVSLRREIAETIEDLRQ